MLNTIKYVKLSLSASTHVYACAKAEIGIPQLVSQTLRSTHYCRNDYRALAWHSLFAEILHFGNYLIYLNYKILNHIRFC